MNPPQLNPDETHLWFAELDGDRASFDRSHAILSKDERDRAARFHFAQDRERWTRCRAILRSLLGSYLRADPAKIQIAGDKHGKPRLEGEHRTASLAFNLSHSGGMALLGFCLGRPIGVDIERLRAVPDAGRMVESYFSSAEKTFFRSSLPERRDEVFLSIWTKKESYLKAIGEGLEHPLDRDPDTSAGWIVEQVCATKGCIAAVATRGALGRLSTFFWEKN